MNNYEITFLLEDSKHTETIKKVIVELAGKVIEEKHWGKQSLVYPINKILVANYFTWKIQFVFGKLNLPGEVIGNKDFINRVDQRLLAQVFFLNNFTGKLDYHFFDGFGVFGIFQKESYFVVIHIS